MEYGEKSNWMLGLGGLEEGNDRRMLKAGVQEAVMWEIRDSTALFCVVLYT